MTTTTEPRIIQGGMGVAISGWQLANAAARAHALGVVSGTALEVVCARRLQDGDPDGHVRRALTHFPLPDMAEHILTAYYIPGGKPTTSPYKNVPMFSTRPARLLQELTVVANFVEVFLAKEGHNGPIGINYLRKIELPLPFACYGAILAGVDYVLVGAGNPAGLPDLLTRLTNHQDAALNIRVQGRPSTDEDVQTCCRPRDYLGPQPHTNAPPLHRPRFLAIVASVDLAAGLAADPTHRPDGFVVEGPRAGGHNAPPRGPRRLDERGQPIYNTADDVDLTAIAALGLPFWLAGAYGTPTGLTHALAAGATGIQVGTAFAFSRESGLATEYKTATLNRVRADTVDVLTDWRASPTGFPFKVIQLPDTLAAQHTYDERPRICDIGALRTPYTRPNNTIGYRCPAEPVRTYTETKGGRLQNTEGRKCLCNALLATAGLAQLRPDGLAEPALVTAGNDFTTVATLLHQLPTTTLDYTAAQVVTYLAGTHQLTTTHTAQPHLRAAS